MEESNSDGLMGEGEDNNEVRLIEACHDRRHNSVIDDLDSEKMEALNANASMATLNMQNYVSTEYPHQKDEIVITGAGEGSYESICVDPENTARTISGLIEQDGRFLQVDNICDDGEGDNIYMTTSNGQTLTYIVTQHNDLEDNPAVEITNSNTQPSTHDELPGARDMLADHVGVVYEQTGDKEVLTPMLEEPKHNTISSANTVRTQLVPISTLASNSATSQNYHTVTVTLVNENNETDPDTNYILLVSNEDGDVDASSASAGNIISITEHKSLNTPTTSKRLLLTQQAVDTENGACSFCNYTTTQKNLLIKHIKTHSEERPHKCHLCGNAFKTMAALNNHLNIHSGKRPHKCKCCDSAFTTSGELIRHIRYKHTFEKPHKCPQCEYASVELSKMKRHIRTHTGERPYQCSMCKYASPDSYKLKRHMRTHTGEKPYACDLCSLKFTQSNTLKAHRRIHLGNKPTFQCELCPATCGRKTDLRIHMEKLHSQESVPLECRKCHKTFDNRYDYKLHVRSHEGERTFKCVFCAFSTLTERKLTEHLILQHENFKPHQCTEDNCEAKFRFKSLLRRHKIFIHGSEDYRPPNKTFSCTCGKKFAIHSNQIKHQEIHAGNSVLSSLIPVLQNIEDIDDIGEELVAEVYTEITTKNSITKELKPRSALPTLSADPIRRKYSDTEDTIRQKVGSFSGGGDSLVMRRIVKEVKGHRVVVMEMGPSELDPLAEEEHHSDMQDQSILDESQETRMSGGDYSFVSGASLSQDAAVQILYNLAADGQLTAESPHQDISESGLPSLSPSERVVTLEMEVLPDNVMTEESVQEGTEDNVLEDNDDQSNLEQISLSVQAASTTLMQLKRSAMEQQVEEQERDSEGMSKRPRLIGEQDDIHGN